MKNSIQRRKPETNKPPIPLLEWVVAAIGSVLVCGSLGFLGYRASIEKSPPVFKSEVLRVVATDNGFLTEIKVHNRGGTAVASLRLSAKAQSDGVSPKQVVIDYLPGHSSRIVAMMFSDRPDRDALQLGVESYALP